MIFSVSVDLDGLGCYAAIHGLDPRALDQSASRAVPLVALGRLCELFAELKIPATLFAIGRELDEVPGAAGALGAAAGAGHEIGSHSYDHDYALSRRPESQIIEDLQKCDAAIARATGGLPPRGFRAPGYTLSPALVAALRARGYSYDSSLLPAPAYYAAKAVAMGLYGLRGRKSHSILGAPGQLFGARGPHWRQGLRELPIATLPLLRAPIIGTLVVAAPEAISARLLQASAAAGHVNLELHGIDVLDKSDVPIEIARAQPGLAAPAAKKLARLRAVLTALRARGEAATLEQAALRLLPH